MIQAYIRLKPLTGLRRSDLLRLTMSDIHEDGIHVTPHKTAGSSGKRMVIEWNDDLRNAVKAAKTNRSVNVSPLLFCNAKGQGYIDENTGTANGWDSMWQRFMFRVLNEAEVTERFTEHDLRAKAGSDAESLEYAHALLAHASDDSTTKRI
jgi:integrase